MLLNQNGFSNETDNRALVPPSLDQNIQKLALGIESAPKVDQATIDLELDLIEIPDGVGL